MLNANLAPNSRRKFAALRGMNSSHLCLACHRSLSRNRLHKVIQWRPRATFISLSAHPPTTTDDKSREVLLDLGNADNASETNNSKVGAFQRRRKRVPRQPSPYKDGDLLEALFEETLKPPRPEAAKISHATISIEPYIHADTLRKMLADSNRTVGDAWKFFVEHFGPEAWKKGTIDQRRVPKHLHVSRNLLTKKLIEAKRMDPFSLTLPTITELSQVYSELGVLHCREWEEAMLVLLESLLKLGHASTQDLEYKRQVTSDIVGAWNVVFRQVGKAQDYLPKDSPHDWSHIPAISISHASNLHHRYGLRGLFAQFTPTFPPRSQANLAVVAVATFAILTRDFIADDPVIQCASPLLSSLGRVISIPDFDLGCLADVKNVPPSIHDLLRKRAITIKAVASNLHSISIETEQRSSSISDLRPSPKFRSLPIGSLSSSIRTDVASITKRLWDAMQRQDAAQVDNLWSDTRHFRVAREPHNSDVSDVAEPARRSIRGTLTADLCNYFILVYMALRKPNRAIEVWNFMVKNNLPPTLKTWDSMMNGCKACRDHKALEDIWGRMLQLGVQPDVVCWTTWISGLIECNKLDRAMHALDDMGRLWVASNKVQFEGLQKQKPGSKKKAVLSEFGSHAVKPTIETINAAVAGLLRRHQTEAAHRVLAWAAKFDIKPDVITYNTLLTPLIRDGHSKLAMELLKQMQKEGVEADVATFTTILDETFRHSSELTPAEQEGITKNVLSEMEAAGVRANVQTYGNLINQLLQSAGGNLRVVNAVMEYMATQGIQPNTYIYTMLVTYYFEREPADVDAVKSLIESASMEVGSVNHIFWDRVIEGYARIGDTTAAIRVLRKLESTGSRPSWVTKEVLLNSLLQNDEWAIAKSFVNNIKADTGGPRLTSALKGQDGQQRFWKLAAELEML